VHTVGEVARLPEDALVTALGVAHGTHISELARNIDDREVTPARVTKSIGNEETFGTDVRSRAELEREVVRLSDRVAGRLRHSGVEARTITLKVRFADFRTITRSRTEPAPTALSNEIAAIARALLAEVDVAKGIRLLGISGSQLVTPASRQGMLDLGLESSDDGRERRTALEDAMDAVRARFGAGAVGAGSLVETAPARREGNE
jgi:DNA polymerase IV